MPEKVPFLISFRGRLMLLLTSFLLLTVAIAFALDLWSHKRADAELVRQSDQVKNAFNSGFGDFAQAFSLGVQSLSSKKYLYEAVSKVHLPSTLKDIIIANEAGKVLDSTLPDLVHQYVTVPPAPSDIPEGEEFEPVEGEVEIQGGLIKTYDVPVTTATGLVWIVIVMEQQSIINQIDTAQITLANKNRELSNYRLGATMGLLVLALSMSTLVGWRFTQPIQLLADAAERVALGDLNLQVNIDRRDEVGRLAATFNKMIAGLKSKLELEERLNQSERAAAIGRLTQAVAHEIKNPLNVIGLTIDHLGNKFMQMDRAGSDKIAGLINTVKDEIARLGQMAGDLMNYGRPAPPSVEKVDVRGLVRETIALVRVQADEQDIQINLEGDDGIPANVMGDRERLKSCLSNITINAIQAMPTGGRLTAGVHRSDGMVQVTVADTGVGISQESISKIFEPYFSTKKSGFGLGLAVTKKIIEEHHGSIHVDSEEGAGTTFTVTLPSVADVSQPMISN